MKEQSQNKTSSNFLKTDGGKSKSNAIEVPSISLPKGAGAIKRIDEKFSVNAVNGTSSFSIPLPVSPARGVSPSLSLSYNAGAGNGICGLGWNLSLGSIKRKTDKALPQYLDSINSDKFLFDKVLYGNKTPYNKFGNAFPNETDYMFQTVFDYGTTNTINEPFDQINSWDFRPDAFSDYKAGFEIRTTRMCQRVL